MQLLCADLLRVQEKGSQRLLGLGTLQQQKHVQQQVSTLCTRTNKQFA
jgi:hypothetical protein